MIWISGDMKWNSWLDFWKATTLEVEKKFDKKSSFRRHNFDRIFTRRRSLAMEGGKIQTLFHYRLLSSTRCRDAKSLVSLEKWRTNGIHIHTGGSGLHRHELRKLWNFTATINTWQICSYVYQGVLAGKLGNSVRTGGVFHFRRVSFWAEINSRNIFGWGEMPGMGISVAMWHT